MSVPPATTAWPPPAPDAPAWRQLAEPEQRARIVALKEELDRVVRRDPRAAVSAAERLVLLAEPFAELLPLALRGRGMASHFVGDNGAARGDFLRASELYADHGQLVESATARRSLIEVCHQLGRNDEALENGRLALDVLEAEGERRLAAQTRTNLGNVLVRLDEYPAARIEYEAALATFRALEDDQGCAFVELNLGVVALNGHEVEEAEQLFTSAAAIFERLGFDVLVADCRYHLAFLESRRGNVQAAIAGLIAVSRSYEQNGKPQGVPLCDLDLAEIHLLIDARYDALELAERAVAAFERLELPYETARALLIAGLARARLEDPEGALADFERAEALLDDLGNEATVALVQLHRAMLETERGRPDQAARLAQELASRLAQRGMHFQAALARLVLARAHLELSNHEEIEAALQPATHLESAAPTLRGALEAERLSLNARSLLARGDVAGARAAFEQAIAAIESTFLDLPSGHLRVAFFRNHYGAYADLARLLATSDDPADWEAGLRSLERGRMRSFQDLAQRAGTQNDEARAAGQRLSWLLQRHLDDELGLGQDPNLRLSSPTLERILEAEVAVARAHRRHAGPDAAPLPVELDLERAVGPDEALLVYLESGDEMIVWKVTRDEVRPLRLTVSRAALADRRDRLLFHLDKLRLGGRYLSERRDALQRTVEPLLRELGAWLIEPLLAEVTESRWVLVPHGRLHDLPFHALQVGDTPLVDLVEVSYALSLSSLRRPAHARPDARSPGFDAPAALPCTLDLLRLQSSTSPHIAAELDGLRERFAERTGELDPDDPAPHSAAALLHVAGHGFFRGSQPILAAVSDGSRLLTARNVLARSWPHGLVTLSGCETGRRQPGVAEDPVGLPRAFLAAGARAVVASLWPVDDASACELMLGFYDQLLEGHDARRALVRSQRAQRARRPHPAHWAPFALLGDPDVCLDVRSHAHLERTES